MKPKVIINGHTLPDSWEAITWKQYTELAESKIQIVEFFCGVPYEQIVSQYGVETTNKLIVNTLSFVSKKPKLEKTIEFDFQECSVAQKITMLNICKMFQDNLDLALGHLLAVATCDPKTYNANQASIKYSEISNKSCIFVLSNGSEVFRQLVEDEKMLSEELTNYRIPTTPEEQQAGINGLERFSDIAYVLMLSGGEFLKMQSAKQTTVREANAYAIYKQRLSFFEWKKQKIEIDKIKKKRK